MTVGGALWFTDLTVADPYYLLPIAASGVFLLTVELGAADGMQVRCAAVGARPSISGSAWLPAESCLLAQCRCWSMGQ